MNLNSIANMDVFSLTSHFYRCQLLHIQLGTVCNKKKSISCIFKEITGEVKIQNIYLSKCFNITLLTANNAINSHVIHFIDKARLPLTNRAEVSLITK